MKNKIILIIAFLLCINTVFASQLEFSVKLTGENESWRWYYVEHSGIEIPLIEDYFTDFSAELVSVNVFDGGFSDESAGEYVFTAQILYSGGLTVIAEKEVLASFYILSNPPTKINETIITFSFNDTISAERLKLFYNDSLILDKEFRWNLLCNPNGICENEFTNSTLFEDHLSCPQDCSDFAADGTCNTAPNSEYSFEDHYCDPDCFYDVDTNNTEAECFNPNCNDGIQNQDETGIDCGGICEDCITCSCIYNEECFKEHEYNPGYPTALACFRRTWMPFGTMGGGAPLPEPEPVCIEEICDGFDNDCDNEIDEDCPLVQEFDPELSTDLTQEDITSVDDLTIGKKNKAKIKFKAKDLDLRNLDLDKNIKIEKHFVQVDTEQLPELNTPSEITMYNVTLKKPRILIDGKVCTECEIISYENNVLVFTVPHWTNYTIDETPEVPAGAPGGGGGGGAAPRPPAVIEPEECTESWICYNWEPEECPESGIQTRDCSDWNACGTQERRPLMEKTCEYVPAPVEKAPIEEAPAIIPEEEPKTYIWMYVIGVIILLIISIIFFIAAKKTTPKQRYKETPKELHSYAKKALSQGYTKKEIKNVLLKEGWDKKTLDDIFKKL